jgi:hypothetical protein
MKKSMVLIAGVTLGAATSYAQAERFDPIRAFYHFSPHVSRDHNPQKP